MQVPRRGRRRVGAPLGPAKLEVFGWWLQLCVGAGADLFPEENPQLSYVPTT